MANHCGFCDTRRPRPTKNYPDGTKIMVLGGEWFEWCEDCEDIELTNEDTGETITLSQLWERLHEEDK